MKKNLKFTKVFLFDLDGTLYLGDRLIDGVKETLDFIRKSGIKVVYLTNNSSKTKDEYCQKLKRMGLYRSGDVIYSSLDAAADYIVENFKNRKVYAVCTKKVKHYLKKQGVVLSDKAEILLLTFDTELDYKKIKAANEMIVKGAKYIVTHPDITCPTEGVYVPDLGSFIEMFKASSGRLPDVIIGKPSTVMGDYLTKKLGIKREEITMVGDRLSTDIAFGVNAGFNTVLVFSGETDEKLYLESEIKADFSISDVTKLLDLL